MKSLLKIKFNVFFINKYNVSGIYWSILTIFMAMAFSGCKKDLETANPFPVNNTIATDLIDKGIPADIAQFFAAAKMETSSPNDTTCIYLQTFPNGATREITLRVSPDRHYTPTPDEIANTIPGSSPIYAIKYSSEIQVDGTTKIKLNYFVPKEDLRKVADLLQIAVNKGETGGVVIYWDEIGKKGTDVSLSSLLDYVKLGPLSSIYTLASALNDITTALDLSKQHKGWIDELYALEVCATNPTNQVARSDPNYSPTTVAMIQDARNELEQVTAVRFLNIMDEKAMDLTLITAVLSIPAKQAFEWSEKTLDNISETLMREVRLAVVRCDDSGLKGNIDILYTDWMQQLEVTHIVTKVNWVLDPGIPCNCYYIAQGSYTYEYTLTTESGPRKITAAGSIDGTGTLQIINDPNLKIMVGCDYLAQGSLFTHLVNFDNQEYLATIAWLPGIKAYLGPGGSFEGETREDNTYNSTVIKWSFSVPGAK